MIGAANSKSARNFTGIDMADSTLSNWRKELESHGGDAFPGSGHQPPLEEENRQLKREVEILRQERDILKKLT